MGRDEDGSSEAEDRQEGGQWPGSSVPQTKGMLLLVSFDMFSVTGSLMPCPFSLSWRVTKLVWPGLGNSMMKTPLSE